MENVNISDKAFKIFIPSVEIETRISQLAAQISLDYQNKTPIFIGVLNGSFMFMANLINKFVGNCNASFVKISSYNGGTKTSGIVQEVLGFDVDITGRDVIIVEDIVDTGKTLEFLLSKITELKPASLSVASLLLKPDALQTQIPQIKYIGFEIENHFVVGYGMDYMNLGRNLKHIYQVC